MHDAYEVIPLIKNLPAGLQIECMCAYDDHVILGTKTGNLLLYQVLPKSTNTTRKSNKETSDNVKLLYSNKSQSKRPITQVDIVPDLNILISLADNVVTVFDTSQGNFVYLTMLPKTKGSHVFALDVQKHKRLTGGVQCTVRLCVAVRKKLQLYYWKNKEFLEFSQDVGVFDIPRTMAWYGKGLFVGFKSEYCRIQITGEYKELFPTGRQLEPLITRLEGEKFALGRDKQTICVDSEGNPTMRYAIAWNEVPLAIAQDPPYLVAVLPSCVEVRATEHRLLIQNIDFAKPRMIAFSKRGCIFVASSTNVWQLSAINLQKQISQLLQEKQFELALHLAGMTDDSDSDKQEHIQQIQNLYAFHLFCKKDFTEAMNIFFKLETDPSHVIGLFPDLLPDEYRSTLEYPDKLEELRGSDLENGLYSLSDYLVQVRHKLMGDMSNSDTKMTAMVEGNKTVRSRKHLLQIIDTTLLKCYLQTNDALVASLLRMPDNHCHVEESERALKKHHKYSELIILYNKKGLHRKALELLMRQSKKVDSPLKGHERTIQYLQHLGKDHVNLIFEFAKWVLQEYPEDGLKIFIEDLEETMHLPRLKVLEYLCNTDSDLVIQYLEHVIHNWGDRTAYFHNMLVRKYCDNIRKKMEDYLHSLPEGQPPVAAGMEPGELGELRKKLIDFLHTSQDYIVDSFPTNFLRDGLFEEGAIVMGKLSRHEEALAIYTLVLQNPKKAEEYCKEHYNPDKYGDKDVFCILLKMYLCPPDNVLSAAHIKQSCVRPNVDAAINILTQFASKIDPFKALSILPLDIPVNQLQSFLVHILQNTVVERHNSQLVKSLLLAEHLQVQSQRIQCQSSKVIISDLKTCRVCQKRIGKSAFARFPDGVIVHYSCKDTYADTR